MHKRRTEEVDDSDEFGRSKHETCPTRILAPVSSTGHIFSKAQEQNSPSCVGAHLTDRLQSNVIIIHRGIVVLSGGHQFEYGRVNDETTRKIPEIRYREVVLQISCTSRGSVSLYSVHTDDSDSLPCKNVAVPGLTCFVMGTEKGGRSRALSDHVIKRGDGIISCNVLQEV